MTTELTNEYGVFSNYGARAVLRRSNAAEPTVSNNSNAARQFPVCCARGRARSNVMS